MCFIKISVPNVLLLSYCLLKSLGVKCHNDCNLPSNDSAKLCMYVCTPGFIDKANIKQI